MKERKNTQTLVILYIIIAITVAVIAVATYRFMSLPSKLSGTWQSTEENYVLTSKNGKVNITQKDIKGQKGVNLTIEAKLKGIKTDEYQPRDVEVRLQMPLEYLSKEQIAEFEEGSDEFEAINTGTHLLIEYKQPMIEDTYKVMDPNRIYTLWITEYKGLVKADKLIVRNDSFAKDGLEFKRKGK